MVGREVIYTGGRAPALAILTDRMGEKNDVRQALASSLHIGEWRNGTLYVGVTSDLCNRVLQHREGKIAGFTRRYGIKMLVWFESHDTMDGAITREKQIKEWRRAWKIELIEKTNPNSLDLFVEACGREDLCSQQATALY